jgi:protein gp37
MGDKSAIQWTDATWNPVRGCAIVSPGCTNCYAMKRAHMMNHRGGAYEGLTTTHGTHRRPVWTGKAIEVPRLLDQPIRWQRPRMIFVNSMSDLFHDDISDEFRDKVFATMALAPQHTYQVLTKRSEEMLEYWSMEWRFALIEGAAQLMWSGRHGGEDPSAWLAVQSLPNLWLGISAENQIRLEERVPNLLECHFGGKRWVSAEPLLSELRFRARPKHIATYLDGLDWVVAGGESGHGARECRAMWIRDIVRQCREASTACFVKQLGARWSFDEETEHSDWLFCKINHSKGGDPKEWPEDLRVQEYPS